MGPGPRAPGQPPPARRGGTMAGPAPMAQLAEAADLKSDQCRFESGWGHPKPMGRDSVAARAPDRHAPPGVESPGSAGARSPDVTDLA